MRWVLGFGVCGAVIVLAAGACAVWGHRQVERSLQIEATPQEVWSVLTDFEAYPQWNPFIAQVTPRAGGAPRGPAQQLDVQITQRGSTTASRPTLQTWVPGVEFSWLGRFGVPRVVDGRHYFRLEPSAAGTRFVHGEEFRGMLVPFAGATLDIADGIDAMNAALRDRVLATIAR